MEEFIEETQDAVLKDKLNIAIDGKGAFRRFKDVLVGYPVDREIWFFKRGSKLRAHMKDWLSAKNIEPSNPPPWEVADSVRESAGSAGFKGSRKSTPFAAQVTADNCARKGMEHGLQKVEVFVKGPGSGRETAIRSLQAAGLEILGVTDVSPQAHNGVRQKKRRRV